MCMVFLKSSNNVMYRISASLQRFARLTILTRKNCVLLSSVQEFIELASDLFHIFTQSTKFYTLHCHIFKGALLSLRQLLAIESFLKMMKNAFCFILKALLVLKIFKFLSWFSVTSKNGLTAIRMLESLAKFSNILD